MLKVGFVGLGRLGLPVAVAMDWKGHDVLGYDINPVYKSSAKIQDVFTSKEAGPDGTGTIQPLLDTSKVKFADSLGEVVEHSDLIFVAIQTPHDPMYEGITRLPPSRVDFSYKWLVEGMSQLSAALDKSDKPQSIVAIISTVLPTTLRKFVFPHLSAKIKLCYNPFFIAMGTVVRDFLDPEFILLGAVDKEAGDTVTTFYKTMTDARVCVTALENAELVKVSYNTFIGMKVAYANLVMEMCDKLPNTNCDEVMNCICLANRRLISPAYLTGGMGDGGGCHPRDNIALSWLCRSLGISYDFYESIMVCREKQTEFLADLICHHVDVSGKPLMILGKAFKPETNLMTGSPAILLRNILEERRMSVQMYDPYVDVHVEPPLQKPHVFFIGCKHDVFKKFEFPQGSRVIDPHRYITQAPGIHVFHVGGENKASGGGLEEVASWGIGE